jgi:glutathionylspermidine synthase
VQRCRIAPRPDWQQQARDVGFVHAILDGKPYWDETTYYRFTLAEIEQGLEAPTETLLGMCYDAVDRILGEPALLRRLAIPQTAWDTIAASWRRKDKDLYGRFDLRFDGTAPPKLYEFNADTPTALFEAAVFQWNWLEQNIAHGAFAKDADQFNSIHEKLIAALGKFGIGRRMLHIAGLRDDDEDRLTVEYLEDCARQAGLKTQLIAVSDIGVTAAGQFTDLEDRIITDLFKLYPWEWLLAEPFGQYLLRDTARIIEPAWKMVLANKGLLAVLWEMYPGHELLLPAYFTGDPRVAALGDACVRKPLLGREGRNIAIGGGAPTEGPYGEEGFVVQGLAELPSYRGHRPVIGSWVIGGEAAGIGIREEDGPITSDTARFVPHVILG